jgi:Na+/H+-dicarboxylate symporter
MPIDWFFELTLNKIASLGIFLIIIFGAVSSCLAFDKETNYKSNFGKIFGSGFATTTTSILITIIVILLSYVINPNLKTQEINEIKTKMILDKIPKNVIEDEINNQNNQFYYLKINTYSFQLLLSGALFIALASLAIAQKNKR